MAINHLNPQTIIVDYEKPYEKMIESSKTHDSAMCILTRKPSWEALRLPTIPTGTQKTKVSFLCNDPGKTMYAVIEKIRSQHLRPVMMTEFAFILKELIKQKNPLDIACLGSLWRNPVDFWLPITEKGLLRLRPVKLLLQQKIIIPTVNHTSDLAKVPLGL